MDGSQAGENIFRKDLWLCYSPRCTRYQFSLCALNKVAMMYHQKSAHSTSETLTLLNDH
jgi:hypothetical protein